MTNKALRILIADGQHFYRLKIERALNQLDYYRIAPIHRLDEVLSAVDFGDTPLDVLIINAALAHSVKFDLLWFIRDNPQIRHVLIYGQSERASPALAWCHVPNVLISAAPLPDPEALAAFMGKVECNTGWSNQGSGSNNPSGAQPITVSG